MDRSLSSLTTTGTLGGALVAERSAARRLEPVVNASKTPAEQMIFMPMILIVCTFRQPFGKFIHLLAKRTRYQLLMILR